MDDPPRPSVPTPDSRPVLAVAAVLGGATGIGFAPILVRLSEVGPSATAAWRVLLALPFLWLLAGLEWRKNPGGVRRPRNGQLVTLAVAGLFFSADLSIWHWSLQFTSVANSTLLTNFAPVFVTFGAWAFLGEKIAPIFVVGMMLALGGAAMLVLDKIHLGANHLAGDALAVLAAIFYAGYLICVRFLRRSLSTLSIMAWSGLVSCPALFCIAWFSGEHSVALDGRGWGVLLALALLSHVGGQTLIAYALGHLPASFSALSLLWQPVMAGLLAWAMLNEPLGLWQAGGGLIVLAGIAIAVRSVPGAGVGRGETLKR